MRTRVRSTKVLSELLDRKLSAYMLAAGAAGAVVLAGTVPAEGEAVCVHTNVSLYGGDTFQLFFPGQRIPAFNLAQTHTTGSSIPYVFFNRGFLIANTAGASAVVASNGYPANLSSAAVVGASAKFGKGNSYGLLFTYASNSRMGGRGNFTRSTNYLGLKFLVSGETHFGWARIKVTADKIRDSQYVTVMHLQAVGYETVAGKSVQVNANCKSADADGPTATNEQSSASLGALARGADSVFLRRRK